MPLYEYQCLRCGLCFEKLQSIVMRGKATCPDCGSCAILTPSIPAPAIIHWRERLPYGTGSRGKYVPSSETGGLPIFVPSWGAMEQAEVDDVAQIAVEKEKERVAKGRPLSERNAETKEALGNIVKVGKSQPEGKRAQTMNKVKKEGLR